MILVGDINLLGMGDPSFPFAYFEEEFGSADIVFGNFECCLYDPLDPPSPSNESFIVPTGIGGEALKRAGMRAVGIANNINFGDAEIKASIVTLDKLGILHTGAGHNRTSAKVPAILERNGLRVGFLQRTSVYWSVNHEATDDSTGVAVIRGHTAYESPYYKSPPGYAPANRPGVPPHIVTWANRACLQQMQEDIRVLNSESL